MKALSLFAAILVCGFAATAHAETAAALKSRCTGMTGIANASMCRTSIGGIVSGLRDNPAYCIPADANNAANLPIVQKYLLAHPDALKLSADEIVGKAMAEAYPCKP